MTGLALAIASIFKSAYWASRDTGVTVKEVGIRTFAIIPRWDSLVTII